MDYIETHGTGHHFGDPIEVGALSEVFKGRKDHPFVDRDCQNEHRPP